MKQSSILKMAAVQIQYELEHIGNIWKPIRDESYMRKVLQILEFLKGKVNCIVFPELSIPYEMIGELKKYADNEKILIIAGSHYVERKNVEQYKKLFDWEFDEKDVRKSICPLIVPNRKIYHIEKINPSLEEDIGYNEAGMKNGELQGVFSIGDYDLGVLICSDFLSSDLRSRILQKASIAIIPQFNANMGRFYRLADSEFQNPNNILKVILLANAIGKTAAGGSAVFMNLGKGHQKISKKMFGYDYAGLIAKEKEEVILLMKINMDYISGRTPSVWTQEHHPVDYLEIPLIKEEESILEILKSVQHAENIESCTDILNAEGNMNIIKKTSNILFKNTRDIDNLELEEIKERFQAILIPKI